MKTVFLGAANSIHMQRWANFFADQGWDVNLISYSPPLEGYHEGVKHHKLFTARGLENVLEPFFRLYRVRKIRRILETIVPDIVGAHDFAKYGEYAYLTGFRPYVLTLWGVSDLRWVQNYLHFFKVKLAGGRKKLRRDAFQNASAITTLISTAKNEIINIFEVEKEKIHSFPWGIDTLLFSKRYEQQVSELKIKLGIAPSDQVIMSSRNMDPFYNIDKIIQASARVMVENDNTFLVLRRLSGSEKYESELKKLVEELGISDRTRFLSEFVPYSEVPVYYNLADVSVMLPKTDQGALSVYETMACGAVVVATDIEGNREMIEHGKNGFLVNPEDIEAVAECIRKALEPGFKEKAYAINHPWIMENADWKKNAKRMEKIYLDAIESFKTKK